MRGVEPVMWYELLVIRSTHLLHVSRPATSGVADGETVVDLAEDSQL